MSDEQPAVRITNCHIHTFNTHHVPKWYPHPLMAPLKAAPFLARLIAALLAALGQERWSDVVYRLHRFQQAGSGLSQREIFENILPYYPDGTRFVVLPMDLSTIDYGPVMKPLEAQHDELHRLSRDEKLGDRVIPFATIVPGKPGGLEEMMRCFEDLEFRGLKLYPRLGFAPDHPELMEHVYPYLEKRGLPVLSHCSRGGVKGRHLTEVRADLWTAPQAFIPVLEAFPKLRVNLAHFGGVGDWRAYIENGIDPFDPQARQENWLAAILDMLRSGKYPGLYTDISYTVFNFAAFLPFLRVFLEDPLVRDKVLFGSDYYMTKQEKLSERAVSFGLRSALGEDTFRLIAETNPEIWLGERTS